VQEHRERFGVEPICKTLGVSASAFYQRRTGQRSARQVEDERLLERIRETHKKNYEAYGYRRTWKALLRAGEQAPRCQLQRLMAANGIRRAKRRGKPWRTTTPDPDAARRPDLVERDFTASSPNELWVADFSYLRCWEGVVFLSFAIDVYSPQGAEMVTRSPVFAGRTCEGRVCRPALLLAWRPQRRVPDQGVRERGIQVIGANLTVRPWEAQALSALARQLTP